MQPNNSSLMLHHVQVDHVRLLEDIQEVEGILTPELMARLEFNEAQLQVAGISVGHLIKSLTYDEDVITAEIERLQRIKERTVKTRDLFKSKLSAAMQQYGIEKLKSPTLTLSFRKSTAVEINDPNEVPATFFDQREPTINKTRIKEAIQNNEVVPGAEIVTRKHLQIK